MSLFLNARAAALVEALLARADELRLEAHPLPCGARVIDCGAKALGGLELGRLLAEVCLAGLGRASFVPCDPRLRSQVAVQVTTDRPLAACMASQYAGWHVTGDNYFAMGSGPMRAAYGHEKLFDEIGCRETADVAVGVLETSQLPPDEVARDIAAKCSVSPTSLTLLAARTKSLAGTVQIVARSVETALHKMHELGGDLTTVVSGYGVAPLPPPAGDDLTALGRTNDAILYGGDVTLWMRSDDATLADLAQRIPSAGSRDFGRPFREIFEQFGRDFYQIDPHLFSPAAVTLINLTTGRSFRSGQVRPDILAQSFEQNP